MHERGRPPVRRREVFDRAPGSLVTVEIGVDGVGPVVGVARRDPRDPMTTSRAAFREGAADTRTVVDNYDDAVGEAAGVDGVLGRNGVERVAPDRRRRSEAARCLYRR